MGGKIDDNVVLDYAVFHTSPTRSSYEALASIEGKMETVAVGPLDQLGLHLSETKRCQTNQSDTGFKLQLGESHEGFSWFTKGTLARFLHIVNSPDALKAAYAIEGEMSQLEETKKFHISLYTKDQERSADGTTDSMLKEAGRTKEIKVETASSDATKNELLRALDLRLTVLEEELSTSFSRAAGATCSTQQVFDLSAFAEHFGAIDLRNFLLKLLARGPKNIPRDPSVAHPVSSQNSRNNSVKSTQDVSSQAQQNVAEPVKNVISLAKIAQAERQSSSGSEESSDSSDEDQSHNESRSTVRCATPRRYASPMRRVQIGRSGSRRSSSITVKSLIPARERTISIRDNSESNSEDEEPDQPAKKPENPVRRISVQDAISLFESKQKDQLDIQKRRASGEVSASTTAKSVLRRWSSGMSDSVTHNSHANASIAAPQDRRGENKTEEIKIDSSNMEESPQVAQSSEVDYTMLSPTESLAEPDIAKVEEVNERAATSAEWSRQKEAELNQMLMRMMESKPGKYRGINGVNSIQKDMLSEQKGGFYSQYKEKRDEKLQAEQHGKRAVKETHLKGMQDSLEHMKTAVSSKSVSAIGKRDSPNHSQRQRRNSSPPVLPNKEVSKHAVIKKASPRTPLATRNSWSAGTLPRTSGTPSPKTPGTVSINSTVNRRKPMSTPPATQPSPRTERVQQAKVKKGAPPDVKPSLKGQEEKKQRSVTKSTKSVKTRTPIIPGDDLSVKPSFYNKGTKKSSVVPLESKPFLKKGTGTGPKCSPKTAKSKVSQRDDSSTNSGNLIQSEENESSAMTAEPTPKVLEVGVVQPEIGNANVKISLDNDLNCNETEDRGKGIGELDSGFKNAVELPVPEIQVEETVCISSAAWVEEDHEEISASCDYSMPDNSISPELASTAALSSLKVRHSLSQMLQADNNEPDIIEWGNAENPPALVYQKDAPKGFKRLLKFARKSKGEANVTGWASPSVFSEGEDDKEESKVASKRSSDGILRKVALQAKGYEPPKSMFSGSVDGANSSNRSMDFHGMSEIVQGQSNGRTATISSAKATRSFFSLSTFRSSKSSETKLQ